MQSLGSVQMLTSIAGTLLAHAIKRKGLSLNAVSISVTKFYNHEICLFRMVKRAVKMGCYWPTFFFLSPSFFFLLFFMDQHEFEVNKSAKKRTRPISNRIDRENLTNIGFTIQSRTVFCFVLGSQSEALAGFACILRIQPYLNSAACAADLNLSLIHISEPTRPY